MVLCLGRCNMTQSKVTEGMVKLTQALVDTAHLRSWFYALEKLPERRRRDSLSEMVAQMRAAGEDRDLTDAVAALSRSEIYKGFLAAVRERVREKEN